MKHTRLLEIIREEIAGALGAETTNIFTSRTLEEDTLNEMAKITEPIRKGIEVAVNRMTKQKSDITPEEITSLIRNKKTQEKVAPELFAALEDDEEEKGGDKKYTAGLGYPQTLGAVQIAMGLKKAKGSEPKAKSEPKTKSEPKVKSEPKAKESKTDAGTDDEGNKVEIDTTVKTLTGDKEIETKLKDVISKKKDKLKAALKQFLEKPEIAKYIKKKTVDKVNPYTLSSIEDDIK